MVEQHRGRFRISLWRHPKSSALYARIRDSRTPGEERRVSTGVKDAPPNASPRTRERIERKAMEVARELCDERIAREKAEKEAEGKPGAIEFEEAYRQWVDEKAVREKTRSGYLEDLGVFKKHFGGMLVRDITFPNGGQRFLRAYRDHKARTRQKHVVTLRGFFRWCKTMNYRAAGDVFGDKKFTKGELHKDHAMSVEEARALLEAARGQRVVRAKGDDRAPEPRLYLALMIGLHTALRPTNIFNVRWCDVDLDEGRITLPPERMKRKREHSIPIHPTLANALREALRGRDKTPAGDEPIVGPKIPKAAYRGAQKRASKILNPDNPSFPHCTWRSLRRTVASWLEPKVSYRTLKSILSHARDDVTSEYTDTPWSVLVDGINELPDLSPKAQDAAVRKAKKERAS